MTKILENIELKWSRANSKALALVTDISTFCVKHPISFDVVYRDERLGINLICNMEKLSVPLKQWSIELGEVVNLLRSSLDNLIYIFAQQVSDPPKKPNKLQFPIIQDSRQYANAIKDIAPQLSKETNDLLERIQPFQRSKPDVEGSPEQDPLVLLNWISNNDKHRMPVPFFIPPKEIKWNQTCQFESDEDASKNVPPDILVHAGPFRNGKMFLEYRTKNPVVKVSGKFEITAHVGFETPNGIRDIAEAINQLTWYCKLIIDEFSKTLKNGQMSN